MNHYSLVIAEQFYSSLDNLYKSKTEYDQPSAKTFVQNCLKEIKKLSFLPHRGTTLSNNYRGRYFKHHLIVYKIGEPDKVYILDIVDPKQHTKASKYL